MCGREGGREMKGERKERRKTDGDKTENFRDGEVVNLIKEDLTKISSFS